MILVLSSLYSILPALASVTARATSGVTVPAFGFGIRPRGTEDVNVYQVVAKDTIEERILELQHTKSCLLYTSRCV